MNKGYKRVVLASFFMAAVTIGYGFIAGIQGPNLSMYAQYSLIGLFTYSQWGLLADVKPRWATPLMLFYTFLVSYTAQYPMSYVDDRAIFFMAFSAAVCGYSLYAAKRAAMESEPLFIDAEPKKRIRNYIIWTMKSMISAFIFSAAYWVYADAIGFVISSLWALVFAVLISWRFIKVYRNQDKNLTVPVDSFTVFAARAVIAAIAFTFLIGFAISVARFRSDSSLLQVVSALLATGPLLVTSFLAFWASDTE